MARYRCPRGANGPRDPTVASFSSTVHWFNDADTNNGTMEQWMEENEAKDPGSQWQCIELKDGTLFGKHSDGFPMLSRTAKEYVARWRMIDFSLRKLPGWQIDNAGPVNDGTGRGAEEDDPLANAVLNAVSTLVDRVILGINGMNLGDPVDTDDEVEPNEAQSSHFSTESNNNESEEDPHEDTQTPPAKRPRPEKTIDYVELSDYSIRMKATRSPTSPSIGPSVEHLLRHENEQVEEFNCSIDEVCKSDVFKNLTGRLVSFAFERTLEESHGQTRNTSFFTYDVGRVYRIVCNGRGGFHVEVDFFGHPTMEVELKLSLYTPRLNEVPSKEGQWKLLKMKTESAHINDIGYRTNPRDGYYLLHPLLKQMGIMALADVSFDSSLRGMRIQFVQKYDSLETFNDYNPPSGCLVWCTGTILSVEPVPSKVVRKQTGKADSVKQWQAKVRFDKRPFLQTPDDGVFTLDPKLYDAIRFPEKENLWHLLKKEISTAHHKKRGSTCRKMKALNRQP